MAVEVTVRDTESGESETATIENDYILITAGTCFADSFSDYPTTGTRIITIKGRNGRSSK